MGLRLFGIGIDMVDCRRIEKAFNFFGKKFLDRLFTETERKKCDGRKERFQSYGKIFSAKEAVIKAFGHGISWKCIEIISDIKGKPFVKLNSIHKYKHIEISITDEVPYAQAIAMVYF